jgi:hypothetical protein
MTRRIVAVAAMLLALGVSVHVADQARPEAAMTRAAQALLAALDDAGRGKIQFAFDSEERFNWHFVPRTRLGLPLKNMSPAQRDLAFALLKTGLSASGFTRAESIRSLENVLRAMEKRDSRDPEMYFLSIFGDPAGPKWGWRYEGHHLSQNWTISSGKAVATSPAFFGANPAEVMDGPMKGTRALAAEHDQSWALFKLLSANELKVALVPGAAPNEIITGNTRKAAVLDPIGITFGEMSPAAQKALVALIELHASSQAPALADARMSRIKGAGFDKLRFAWIGATAPGAGHYYRIQGPTFLIEYDNVQNNANHQHIVWRDFNGDFGVDLLAEHYTADPVHRASIGQPGR